MATRYKKKRAIVWSAEDDDLLVRVVRNHQHARDDFSFYDLDWREIAPHIPGKPTEECIGRLRDIHTAGELFATIDEVWRIHSNESARHSIVIDVGTRWDASQGEICRKAAPNFERLHLQRETRNPREFFVTANAAHRHTTTVGESITTVNDALIPVDIFGAGITAADKAHLLPKARDDALTWKYPGCAVLGIDMRYVDTHVAEKAVLGCQDDENTSDKSPPTKYPGIRNFLCNILRMSNQGPVFDKNPLVLIFPVLRTQSARNWAGRGYDAIVLCESATVATRIGVNSVKLYDTESASLGDINTAVELASRVCEFLALSVLKKTQAQVDEYQAVQDRVKHERFRSERRLIVPFTLSAMPLKPVFKISFVGHDEMQEDGHPAPDPLLLAFKSCNNWCRKHAGFRMLAGADPEEEDDDLSDEGRRNLQKYLEWQALQDQNQQHEEIMNLFGNSGGINVGMSVS